MRADPPTDSVAWGPLAIVEPAQGYSQALLTGRLRFDDECVVLEAADSRRYLVVWPAGRVAWDATTQMIRFTTLGGRTVDLLNGSEVRLGGGGQSVGEGAIADGKWVVPPHSSCPTAALWWVGEVDL